MIYSIVLQENGMESNVSFTRSGLRLEGQWSQIFKSNISLIF